MIMGLVQMLAYLRRPDHIGAGMALALLGVFYAGIIAELICNPLKHALIAGSPGEACRKVSTGGVRLSRSNLVFVLPSFLLALLCFFVLIIAFGDFK